MTMHLNHTEHRELYPTLGKPRDLVWPAVLDSRMQAIMQHECFADFLKRDDVPIPALEDRGGLSPDKDYYYWLSGFFTYLNIRKNMPELPSEGLRILDFGGATGRVVRHILTSGIASQMMIVDIASECIDWVNTYFGSNCRGICLDRVNSSNSPPIFPFRTIHLILGSAYLFSRISIWMNLYG